MATPLCGKCRNNHYNFQACPKPETHPGWGRSFGTALKGAQVTYQLPPRLRMGRLVGPDGKDYQPPEAA